jgi:hypothetical protein
MKDPDDVCLVRCIRCGKKSAVGLCNKCRGSMIQTLGSLGMEVCIADGCAKKRCNGTMHCRLHSGGLNYRRGV